MSHNTNFTDQVIIIHESDKNISQDFHAVIFHFIITLIKVALFLLTYKHKNFQDHALNDASFPTSQDWMMLKIRQLKSTTVEAISNIIKPIPSFN
jgi:hypothetical protein